LGTFNLTVSGDAAAGSTFDIAILAGGATYVRDENNAALPIDVLGPCTLRIENCNPCQQYGDIEPPGSGSWAGDCDVDVDDILCALAGFSNPPDCATGDLEPCGGDGDIDVDDLLAILDAFSGLPACPAPCGF